MCLWGGRGGKEGGGYAIQLRNHSYRPLILRCVCFLFICLLFWAVFDCFGFGFVCSFCLFVVVIVSGWVGVQTQRKEKDHSALA